MRAYVLAVLTAVFFFLPTSAFSQVDVEVGPGGVYVGPRHRGYDNGYHRGDRYGGGLRQLPPIALPSFVLFSTMVLWSVFLTLSLIRKWINANKR